MEKEEIYLILSIKSQGRLFKNRGLPLVSNEFRLLHASLYFSPVAIKHFFYANVILGFSNIVIYLFNCNYVKKEKYIFLFFYSRLTLSNPGGREFGPAILSCITFFLSTQMLCRFRTFSLYLFDTLWKNFDYFRCLGQEIWHFCW